MNMNNSIVSILDLSDEILLIIFKKLNNIDALYSFVGVNNNKKRAIDWKTSQIRDRIFMHILPRIHENVEYLTVQGCF